MFDPDIITIFYMLPYLMCVVFAWPLQTDKHIIMKQEFITLYFFKIVSSLLHIFRMNICDNDCRYKALFNYSYIILQNEPKLSVSFFQSKNIIENKFIMKWTFKRQMHNEPEKDHLSNGVFHNLTLSWFCEQDKMSSFKEQKINFGG